MFKRALILVLICFCSTLFAEERIWSDRVNTDGTKTIEIPLEAGSYYQLSVEGYANFGKWWKNQKDLLNDACYEFNAMGQPEPIPVLKNNYNISVCEGTYNSDHIYRSKSFAADGKPLQLWIFDTDHSDNSGFLLIDVWKVDIQSGDGYYVAFRNYFPRTPEVSEGVEFKEYIQDLTSKEVLSWEPAGEPLFVFVSSDVIGLTQSMFKPGERFSLPLSMEVSSGKDTVTIDGTFLLEVMQTFDSLEELSKAFPGKTFTQTEGALDLLKITGEDGVFTEAQSNEQGSLIIQGGPFKSGWSDSDRLANLDMMKAVIKHFNCFIATAIYRSWEAAELEVLRNFRDKILLSSDAGKRLINWYYRVGPGWALWVKKHPMVETLLKPCVDGFVFIARCLDLDAQGTKNLFEIFLHQFSPEDKESISMDLIFENCVK